VELTHNWDGDEGLPSDSRHFGHLAYEVDDIYALCQELMDQGITINRPPRDGRMAFVRSPDNVSIETAAARGRQAAAEPWARWAIRGMVSRRLAGL
jgi:lactoylglutathione lyase